MIHQYKSNGYNIVLDVESGAVHVVDDITYDVISLYEGNSADEIVSKLKSSYNMDEIRECISEVKELVEDGQLFTEDIYEPFVEKFKEKRQTVVKALCLHIAHDCNLACKYCFAEEGEYHGRRALMSFEVGKKALDFLVANSSPVTSSGNSTTVCTAVFSHASVSPFRAELSTVSPPSVRIPSAGTRSPD